MRTFCLLVLLIASGSGMAQYRCVENGKTLFTDRPCLTDAPSPENPPKGNAPKVIGDAGNSAYRSPYGSWRGQIQYQEKGPAGINRTAMAVVPMLMDIDPQGRVVGSSPENGCRFKGIASPGSIPTSIALDITFSGCYFAGYNRRMFGSLAIHQAQKFAQFSLMGHHITPLFASYFFDVKGTLRR